MPDALPVAIADTSALIAFEYRTDVIATLDRRHFPVIRPLTRHAAFRLLHKPTRIAIQDRRVGDS